MTQEAILLELKELLDKNNISFWLQSGTLLGAYRDNNFIKWDNADIDLGLLSEDYWKVRQILENSDSTVARLNSRRSRCWNSANASKLSSALKLLINCVRSTRSSVRYVQIGLPLRVSPNL